MGRCQIVLFSFALLLTLFVSAQLCVCDPQKAAPAAPSFFKGWSDWAQGKIPYGTKKGETKGAASDEGKIPYGSKEGETKGAASDAGSWSNWASDKISSFSGRASKNAGKATQAGKEKVKAEGEAASKEAEEMLEGAKEGVKEGSEKAKEYAKQGSEKAQEYAGKVTGGIHHQADKTYDAGSHKLKEDAEL